MITKASKTAKIIYTFYKTTKKNYKSMKEKLKKVWLTAVIIGIACITFNSCNVTRKMTTESSFYQRGDTTCTIIVKTIETYDAEKKGK